jgi:transposase
MEFGLEAFRPLVSQGYLETCIRGITRCRPRVARARFHGDTSAPVRGRRQKKADGTGGQDEQALGRSRGGFGTKIHGGVNGLGLPVKLILTPGQAADVTQAKALIEDVPIEVVIGDKGYDSRAVVEAIEARGAQAVIPTQKDRKQQRAYDRDRYKDRNLVERFWFKLKQYRRVATRYEKTARNFMGFIMVASIMVLLR